MTRVKTGPTKRARHNKVLARTSGFRMTKNRLYKVAHEAYMHALQYAFEGRRKKKGDFRSLWIVRINAGLALLCLKDRQLPTKVQTTNEEEPTKFFARLHQEI